MHISPALARVQQRIVELHPRPPAPPGPPTPTSFSDVLARQVAATAPAPDGAGTAARALHASASGVAAPPPPQGVGRARSTMDLTALRAYGNGRIPAAALVSIGHGHHRLAAPAARAFVEMTRAAAADGVRIGVTDSYRSYDQQVDVARRKGLYAEGGLAARPGTSDHGWGLAVDLDLDARAQSWMRANAARYGFVEDTPREPWHWAYKAAG